MPKFCECGSLKERRRFTDKQGRFLGFTCDGCELERKKQLYPEDFAPKNIDMEEISRVYDRYEVAAAKSMSSRVVT
jgi:hypothetical protein